VTRLLAALLLLLVGCGDAPETGHGHGKGEAPPPVVEVLQVSPRTLEDEAELLGQLEAEESVVVHSEVPGIIESVEFQEGQPVEAGQVLFRLRDDEPLARLHEAQAELALAEDSFQRTRGLAERNVVSSAEVERVTAALAVARARVEVAQVALDRSRIKAPFDGVTGPRLVSPGRWVEPEDELVKVEAIATLELVFTLPEQVLPLARAGVPVELSVAPYPGETFPGEVFFVAPSINPENRRLLVKARVPNPDLRLRPGLFARVSARIAKRENALVLPEDAVVYGSEGSFVWRVDEGDVVQRVEVELGIRRAGRVEIRSGLAPGDRVVVAGTNKLSPGVHVESVPAPEDVAAAPASPPGVSDAPTEVTP
jgi:membrane fusion protein (multidrug efflux system)